jgi:hypothetical protein
MTVGCDRVGARYPPTWPGIAVNNVIGAKADRLGGVARKCQQKSEELLEITDFELEDGCPLGIANYWRVRSMQALMYIGAYW